jgi:hypothetical protein
MEILEPLLASLEVAASSSNSSENPKGCLKNFLIIFAIIGGFYLIIYLLSKR